MPRDVDGAAVAPRRQRVRVTNRTARVQVAFDAGSHMTFEAEQPSPDFRFEVDIEPERFSVWFAGTCGAVTAIAADGARERFA
jgi:hypothetical protein